MAVNEKRGLIIEEEWEDIWEGLEGGKEARNILIKLKSQAN